MSDITQFRVDFTAVYAYWRDTGEPDVGAREKSAAAAAVQAHMHDDDWMRGAAATFRRIREDQERDIARRERIKAEVRAERAQRWDGRVWLTIAEDDTISSCLSDCRKHHPRNVQNAEWSSRFPLSISVPAPADHLAFVHVAGSVWHKTTPSESGEPENSAQANDGNTQNQGCSNALNAGLCIQQHLNTSGQSQNAAMASPHGAANVQEQKRAMAGQSSGSPTKESRRSRKSGSDISNPNEEGKPSRPAHECITQSDASVELICRLSGAMPTGWTVSELLGASAHTAGLQTTCTKTTSSHYHTLNVPELLSATWSPHVGHATCQKAQSIQVPGLRTKLLSLGLIEPCGCFIGTYKPRIWLNPPFGREAIKWLRRMVDHGNGVALIPARTETVMFYETVWGAADAVLFMRGRPHFHYVDGRRAAANSGAPICLVAYGVANVAALESSGLGIVLPIIGRKAA